MRLIRDLNKLPQDCRGGAVSIGNFDGVHLGHAGIIERLVRRSRQTGGPPIVFTFDPHPAAILRPDRAPPPLTRTDRKAELLAALGVEVVVAFPTDRGLLELEAQAFFHEIVRDRLDARAIVEGANFHFGRRRSGNVDALRSLCDETGISLDIVEPVEFQGEIVSSSRVRESVARGRVDLARRMLTRPYRILGTVEHGAGRGAKLGYPTANIGRVRTLLPAEGIYCGRAFATDEPSVAAISIGPNPTFDEGGLKVEVHLLDYEGDLYDRELEVDFLAPLRNIVRFESVDQLIAQMDRDIADCRRIAAEVS